MGPQEIFSWKPKGSRFTARSADVRRRTLFSTSSEAGQAQRRRGPFSAVCSALHEALEPLAPARVAELAQRLRLDLSYTLARDGEFLADLFQRMVGFLADAEAHPEHLLLARCERRQDLARLLLEIDVHHRVRRRHDALVLDEVAEMAVFLLADRRLEGDGLLGDLQDFAHLVQ